MTDQLKIFEEGMNARALNLEIWMNPYKEETPANEWWKRGWKLEDWRIKRNGRFQQNQAERDKI